MCLEVVICLASHIVRIFRQPHIECFARANDIHQCLHGLLKRRGGVIAVRVIDIDILQVHPPQTLVKACYQAFARAPIAIGTGPHQMSSLGGYEQLVAMRVERLLHVASEALLGSTIGRAVVVGQVKMADAMIESRVNNFQAKRLIMMFTKVMPKAQRNLRQQHSTLSCPSIGHRFIAILSRHISILIHTLFAHFDYLVKIDRSSVSNNSVLHYFRKQILFLPNICGLLDNRYFCSV